MNQSGKITETPGWHQLSTDQVFSRLGSTPEGLAFDEAQRRLDAYGSNELETGPGISVISLFLAQFKSALVLILLSGIAFSIYVGHDLEAAVIGAIVLLAVLLGFVQEYRTGKAVEALKKMAAPSCRVIRDGEAVELPAHSLATGDVVLLQAGNRVPADLRVFESFSLKVNESSLTGESAPVDKHSRVLANDAPLADRHNMLYGGTLLTSGRARAIVVATGMDTEFGRIVKLVQGATARKTPLQKNLDKVGNSLVLVALVLVGLIVALGVSRGEPVHEMILFGIALAVAVVPEALPAVVTISLAIGAHRMVKRNALIRTLPAVETLGCTSVICSDKTGTLTRDEMTVRKLWVAGETFDFTGVGYKPDGEVLTHGVTAETTPAMAAVLGAMALVNDAVLGQDAQGRWVLHGDPTEGALLVAGLKAGLGKSRLDAWFPRIDEIPFESETRCMTTLHAGPDGVQLAVTKGALEVVLAQCDRWLAPGGEQMLDSPGRQRILDEASELARQALRVLAVAIRERAELESARSNLCFLGMVGMIDPPRPESRAAIRQCEQAGIKVIMITGDHPLTARAVGQELGILRQGRVVTGVELDAMDDRLLAESIRTIEVFARVSPDHKLRVVSALQSMGRVVAMTGDGVNDAPALRQADIGVAMGMGGTDVSREASAMILTDDNFASIVAAVEEGRGIYSNIKKYLMYLLSSNAGEIGLMAGAMLSGLPTPLSAVQILYVNLVTDGLPALALAVDPMDADIMQQKPRSPGRSIFTRPVVLLMLLGGLWSTVINLGLFVWAHYYEARSLPESMTLVFVCLVIIQFFKAYGFRSDTQSVFCRPFSNLWLNASILGELILLAAIIHVPWLANLFGVVAIEFIDWARILLVAASIIPVLETAKWWIRRKRMI